MGLALHHPRLILAQPIQRIHQRIKLPIGRLNLSLDFLVADGE